MHFVRRSSSVRWLQSEIIFENLFNWMGLRMGFAYFCVHTLRGNILHHKNVWFEIVWQFLELRYNVIAFCSWKESNTNKMFMPSFCNMIFFPKKISFHVIGETTVIFTEHLTMHFQRTIAKGPLRLPLLPFLIFKTVIFTSIGRRQSFSDWLNFAFWLQF